MHERVDDGGYHIGLGDADRGKAVGELVDGVEGEVGLKFGSGGGLVPVDVGEGVGGDEGCEGGEEEGKEEEVHDGNCCDR